MKKALTLLLAAALSGLASAVTLNWSDGYKAGSTASANWGTQTKLEVTIVFDATGLGTSAGARQDFFSVCFGGSMDNTYNSLVVRRRAGQTTSIRLVENGQSGNNGQNYSTADTAFTIGENTLTLIFDKTGGKASYILKGGTETSIGTQTLTYADDGTINFVVNSDIASLGSITSVEAKLVPEPTVLALLAIGVAGVALRRKMA